VATVTNWKTHRRGYVLGALALFVLSGVATGVLLEPLFADIIATGYRDTVDPALQRQAERWYAWDWGLRGIDAVAGVTLLVALSRSPSDRT
jgi:hypothetical protein